jgi:U5 snRNP protein, DIM1 family
MKMDEVLYSIAEKVKNFAVIYLVDITLVPDFNKMYELYDPCTTMFFFRNKHIMIDLGTGNNNKINWPLEDKQVRLGGQPWWTWVFNELIFASRK